MVNETIRKFNYPQTLIREYEHWVVLVRPAQVTVGSLVLASKEEATRFPDLSGPGFAQLHRVCADLENALSAAYSYEKINYLMLMMMDKHVHYHVVPRYSSAVEVNGRAHNDPHWPGPPDVTRAIDVSAEDLSMIQQAIAARWPA